MTRSRGQLAPGAGRRTGGTSTYVSDVVRRLPRRQRGDVAVELRALLREELAGRVENRGAEPDQATPDDAMALLTDFGRPAEVAARYRPTFTIIDPADSRSFLKASVIGVALIWIIGLIDAFADRPASIGDGLLALQDFYFTVGLPALMWPGLLVVWFGLAAWTRRRWPRTAAWKPRPEERNTVNRFGLACAIAFYVAGTAVLVNPAGALDFVSGGRLPEAGAAADQLVKAVTAIIILGMLIDLVLRARRRYLAATATPRLS